ncbi:uncharacterized protein TRAVEDRAFT_60256 [Trametes versicolor FP-101664 SS1]|uniref:uncharacterized protein n=1 Tax=Trametes versicolor (strain FP-101664) TaxID=717944 RepID=UPI00046227B1|nr:uncharacterized protein TRAVEDRAFT_60256 [Trametes versicolor FP-101664 SS1]EIW54818.1 hypothetical protein TRAVEDRAFT_60256 [Trametes versicolor FP-101664 SS1]
MSSEPAKSSSSSSASPQEGAQPPPVPQYAQPPPYGGHYPPPPGPYPPFYAYPVPDPSHHDPNAPNGAPAQPVAPFFMAVPPPPPGMVYAYPMPPTAPGYPYAAGLPPPQPTPKAKRKQVKMACTNCAGACKRCDEARPCDRCVKYGLAETCVDGVRKERKKGIKRGPYKRKNRNASGEPSTAGEGDQPVAAPAGYPMPPEGYPFPFVYPPYGYMPPPADGQQHPEGAPNGAPPMPHPVYPPYPTMYPHPYGAYPGAPPMGYPPMMGAPVATSPNPSAKPDSSGPAPTNGSVSAEPTKSKKRSRAKGEEGSRSHKKHKEARADDGQPGGEALPKDPPQPSPFVGHPEGGPAATFNGPEPRPLMATM